MSIILSFYLKCSWIAVDEGVSVGKSVGNEFFIRFWFGDGMSAFEDVLEVDIRSKSNFRLSKARNFFLVFLAFSNPVPCVCLRFSRCKSEILWWPPFSSVHELSTLRILDKNIASAPTTSAIDVHRGGRQASTVGVARVVGAHRVKGFFFRYDFHNFKLSA